MKFDGNNRISRRAFLAAGASGILTASAIPARARPETLARSVILLWMDGGPSQFETFDPKPDAPSGIRGEFGAIPTSVPGLRISELMPLMARRMNRCTLIRSVTHDHAVHERACQAMLTGAVSDSDIILPSIGSVIARGNLDSAFPYAALPGSSFAFGYARAGFLGSRYDPIIPDRCRAQPAFEIDAEPLGVREIYGNHPFGRNCLRARRLVEAGTRFVVVSHGGWDTHSDIAAAAGDLLVPPLDQGMSALIDDLHQRGLLATTLVVWMGEFGRSPQINPLGGRDHWPQSGCALFSGAGVPGGQVIGATDFRGESPTESTVSPADVFTTILSKTGAVRNVRLSGVGGRTLKELG